MHRIVSGLSPSYNITITVSAIIIIIRKASIMIRCNYDNYDNDKKVT